MTQRKQNTTDQSCDNLNALFFDNPIPMVIDDQDKIVTANKAFRKVTGYLLKDIVGKTRVEIGLLDQRQDDFLKQVTSRQGNIKKHKIQARHKDGSILKGYVSRNPFLYQNKDCFLVTLVNETEILGEKAKREELELYFDLSPNLVATTSLEGFFVKYNQTWRKLLGYTKKDLSQFRLMDLIHPDDVILVKIVLKDLSRAENVEVRILHKEGHYLHIDWNIRKYRSVIYYIGKDSTKRVKAHNALAAERELFKTTLFSLSEAVIVTDAQSNITLMNKLAEDYTGIQSQEALGHSFDEIFYAINMESNVRVSDLSKEIIETKIPFVSFSSLGLISKEGTKRYIFCRSALVFDEREQIKGAVITFMDRSESMEQAAEIEGFLNVNLDILCVSDKDSYFHRVNKRFEEVLGYSSDEVVGKSFFSFIVEEDAGSTLDALNELKDNKVVSGFMNRYRCKDGSFKYIEWYSQPGPGKFVYSSARDVTERYNTIKELREQVIRDGLTGLYNRRFFDERGQEEIRRCDRSNQPLSLIMFDIDHFKNINDVFGHPVGDLVLKEIASLVKSSIRSTDLLFRIGGEEFLILTLDTPLIGAKRIAEKILDRLRHNNHPIAGNYTASFGVCERLPAESLKSLFDRVDAALYVAKNNGRNQMVCDEKTVEKPIALIELAFKPQWESGHPLIDAQHSQLISLANQIMNTTPNDLNKTSALIEMLVEDITRHFQDEEEILTQIGYMDLSNHHTNHTMLLDKAMTLKNDDAHHVLKSSAFFAFIVDEVIVGHIIREDQKYFAYLKKN